MAAKAAAPSLPLEIFRPEYVKFLLSPSTPLDFHVNVGDPKSEEMERIGALRWMLIARSKVLRVMLFESQLKPGKEFNITDLDPETFKHFLTFIYGYDNTGSLPFEDAVKLLGAAEKYDVPDLKDLLAKEITPQVTASNVCTVLQHGPVCESVPALWEKATDMVQSYTEIVFGQEQFLTLRPEAVVHILQQDALSVQEVEVWRAALKWARHQLSPRSGPPTPQDLRRTIFPLLQHTRLCTLTPAELCKSVLPTQILTPEEISSICLTSKKQNDDASNLSKICRDIKKRRPKPLDSAMKTLAITTPYSDSYLDSKHIILTKYSKVKMVSLEFKGRAMPTSWTMVPKGLTYKCHARIKIQKVTNYNDNSSSEPSREITFTAQIPYGQPAGMPLNVDLEANTKYTMEVKFDNYHPCISYNSLQNMNKITDWFEIGGFPTFSGNHQRSHFRKWNYKLWD